MIRKIGAFERLAVMAALLGFAPGAFAYLDPSTGSMILSAIVGIFATVSLAIKTYWYKLKSLFGDRSDEVSEAREQSEDATEDMSGS